MILTRRRFLQHAAAATGAFVLGCYVPLRNRALAQGALASGVFDPNVFLKIGADNSVTILSKHFEMGQGIATGLATLIAEELAADWSKVRVEFAPNNPKLYNNLVFGPYMATGGSTSIVNSWEQMRKVGAAARMMLVAAAAQEWGVAPGEITVANGVLRHAATGRRATFGELAADAMRVPVPSEVPLKQPKDWKLIGKRVRRVDSASKTTGSAVYALDIHRPGMLTAVVKRPEQFGATVASVDSTQARSVPGVVDVVQIPSGVAVLANDTWAAMRGRDALNVAWDTSKAETRSRAEIFEQYRQLANDQGLPALRRGDAAARLAGAAKALDAEFTFDYLAHAPMEPLNCTIELRADGAEIWSGCQLQSIDQYISSKLLGLKPEQIRIHTLYGGGSFGRRGNPLGDWTVELCSIAKAIGGKAPVHLVWTREDDIKGGFYRPLSLQRVHAGVDAGGRISGWRHKLVNKSIFTGTPFEGMTVKDRVDHSSVEGVVDTHYSIGDFSVESFNAVSPVPVLWWRSVGHGANAFVMETVLDELARLAGKDPLAFRLELLGDHPRDRAVLSLAAAKAGWNRKPAKGRGRGIAYHYSFNTRIAMVADVTVQRGAVKVERVVAAVDCGTAVNPDLVKAQIEGAIGFALSSVLRERVTLEKGVVQQSNFHDYEPTRISEMPRVEVHIVKSTEPPSGIGEPGVPPLAPAVGNAIYAATGKRFRSLPFNLPELA